MKKLIATLAVCLVGFAGVCAQQLPALTSAQYANMNKGDVYVIMFTTQGCSPCELAKKTFFPKLVKKYADESNVHVYLFPVDEDTPAPDGTSLSTQLRIDRAPTFVVLYNDASMFSYSGFSPNQASKLESDIASAVASKK